MFTPAEPFRHRTKEDYAYDVLRAAILRCELKPGDRLVIDTLSSQLGISPIPMRAALQRLQAEGLAEITPHTGAVVSELSPAAIEQVSLMLERLELMGFEFAAQCARAEEIDALRNHVAEMDTVLQAGDTEHWSEMNNEFHRAIADLSGNKLLAEFTGRTLDDWIRLRRWYLPDVVAQLSQAQAEHREMVELLARRDLPAPATPGLQPPSTHPRTASSRGGGADPLGRAAIKGRSSQGPTGGRQVKMKERFLAALYGHPVDRPPVAAVTTGITVEMQQRVGIHWPEAHRHADQLAGLAEAIHLCTETECIKLPFCMTVEVEALGATVDYRTFDTIPTETHHIWNHPDELTLPADFFDRGRVPVVLRAIETLRRRYDAEIPIVTSIVGPWSLASKLFGFESFLVWTLEQPEWVHRIMAALTPLAIRYARAQVDAGADAVIMGEAGSSGDLISARTYRDFIAPYHRELCPAIPAPTILHICGKSTGHTKYIADTGATAYNFDEGVDARVAHMNLDGKVALTGYVPTVKVLLNGTPEDVYRSATECLNAGVHLLTPGCALAPHTPLVNIAAMVEAMRDWDRRRQDSTRPGVDGG